MRTAAVALCALLASPARAVRPITPAAPEFTRGAAWINSRPMTLAQLRKHRVVVVAFTNHFNANSVRVLERLNRWWRQYSPHGLMVVGVHTPDYDFDRDPVIVRKAVRRLGVRYPVMLDNGRVLWRAYQNEGWPALFLIDEQGRIIHDRLGEGGSAEFETELLAALDRMNGWRPPRSYRPPKDPPRDLCGETTPSLYLGARRGKRAIPLDDDAHAGRVLSKARDGELAVSGNWATDTDALRFDEARQGWEGRMQVVYQGGQAHAVMTRASPQPAAVYVKQDGLWLHPGNANMDVRWDKEDRSYVLVDEPRLHHLTKNKADGMHELTLYPSQKGVAVAGFEFSDRCAGEPEQGASR